MAELLIVVVAVVVLLLYATDRARKLRARARQMAAMNERLDVAAAKVDHEQQQKRAVVRASAELTSVLPAIRRPPLTLPGVPGPGAGPGEEAAPEDEPARTPAADADPEDGKAGPPAADADTALAADTADGMAAQAGPPAGAGEKAAAEDGAAAGSGPDTGPDPDQETAAEPAGGTAADLPAAKLQVTSEGTLIMPTVPDQGPAPAGEAVPPDTMWDRAATRQERADR
jgi:hypothetical protein